MTETIRIHETYFFDFCLELQSKVREGWSVNEADVGCVYAKPGIYMCNMSREILQVEDDAATDAPEKPVKPVGRPKQGK